ncbi:MAG: S-DNA-T family DNA segregation ATPase FtsK/SpoIIIE, partial [Myxococcota bacterium]
SNEGPNEPLADEPSSVPGAPTPDDDETTHVPVIRAASVTRPPAAVSIPAAKAPEPAAEVTDEIPIVEPPRRALSFETDSPQDVVVAPVPPSVAAPSTVVEATPATSVDADDEGQVVELEAVAETEADADGNIKIVESAAMRRRGDLVVGEQLALDSDSNAPRPYVLPGLSMLDYKAPETMSYDREYLRRNAQILEAKLLDYRVKGKVVEIHPGPVITMYEFMPAPGVKISSIANLSDDLAMALSALRIRIVAPIPGKNVVGIEVPNQAREIVWMKEVLSDSIFIKAKSKLTLALGKDIVGNPAIMDLQKAPHLLVAGATGSGKSVAINSFIVSILYQAKPEDVRLIMVDPKMLELSIYEGIPHLLLPVVTDPKQASIALKWAVKEMERRYRLMADMGVRNLSNYNAKVLAFAENPTQRLPEKLRIAKLKREAKGEADPPGAVRDAEGKDIEKLPLIVVIIDELADLMMVASKEVEHSIARLAQMARACGIHLILATQRPSVDVITGLIKANFPTRISFQVASKIDSRTILDRSGAENLLGMGDMLYMPPGTSTVKRVHGNYVSEEEIHALVDHLKAQGQPDYDLGILAHEDEDSGRTFGSDDSDELYDRAVRIVAETRNASISFLQRKLKIGYNRSARIVEQMEDEGIIGPSDGTSRPREVFIEEL